MAITKSSLKSKIKSNLEDHGFRFDAVGRNPIPWLDNFIDAISEAVIDEIHQNAKAVGSDTRGDSHNLSIE